MSLPLDIERAHAPKDVDVSAAGRGVWLVKVPKYLSEQWKSFPPGTDVGKLKISKSKVPNKKPDIIFSTVASASAQSKPTATTTISSTSATNPASMSMVALGQPRKPTPAASNQDHKFLVTNVGNQKLVVMSQAKSDPSSNSSDSAATDKICVEGKVMQRAECHPIVDAAYKHLKRAQVRAQNTPQRQMKLLHSFGQTYKPVKEHPSIIEDRKAKKADKRSRAEKDKVLDILYSAFEKHQFYTIKNLVGITKQPVPYLKEILKEICNYNMTTPHKNMWELKPEFRYYKSSEDGGGGGGD